MVKNVLNTDQGSLFPIFAVFMSAITHSGAVTSLVPPESHPEKISGKCKIRPGVKNSPESYPEKSSGKCKNRPGVFIFSKNCNVLLALTVTDKWQRQNLNTSESSGKCEYRPGVSISLKYNASLVEKLRKK